MKRAIPAIAATLSAGPAPAGAEPPAPGKDVAAIKSILNTACVDRANKKIDGRTWYF